MNTRSFTNVYIWGLKGLLFITPFLSLYIARSMFFPFITGRNFAFRIIIEIAFVLWLGLVFLNKEYRPRMTPLLWVLIAFMIILGAADLFGVDPYNSFWSRYERMEGYILFLHLFAYFLIVTSVFRTKKDWMKLFNVFIFVGFLIGGYALMQRLGYIEAIQGGRLRVDGTIGNPTYLAGYLLFILGFCLYFLSTTQKKWQRWYYGVGIAFTLLIIYFTASRGPILALVGGTVLYPLLYLIFTRSKNEREKKLRKYITIALGVAVVFPIIFFVIRDTSFIQKNSTFSRFANISLTEKTTRSRFMIWKMGWEGFKERPILGWGQENYTEVFSTQFNPNLFDQEPWFDRAHNIVVDWMINAGALGIIAYLALFVVSFRMLWKAFRDNVLGFPEASLLTITFVVYFAQNIFVFDNFNTYLVFFSILGFIHKTSQFGDEHVAKHENSRLTTNEQIQHFALVGVAVVLIVSAMYSVNIKPIQQSRALIQGLITASNNASVETVQDVFEEALAYNTFGNTETREQLTSLANNILNVDLGPDTKARFANFALAEMKKQVEEHPRDLRSLLSLGALYNRASIIDAEYQATARVYIDRALEVSPTRQTAYYTLADNYLLVNEFDPALEALQKAADLAPQNMEAQSNLGRIALFGGRDDIADSVLIAIEKNKTALNPNNVRYLIILADVYISQQKFDNALELYVLLLPAARGLDDEGQYYANTAGLYLNQGDKEQAREHALKAKELNPDLGFAVDQFIQEL
jgi:O-antigen ligase/tetratricopeptide (TPR) repeat protein